MGSVASLYLLLAGPHPCSLSRRVSAPRSKRFSRLAMIASTGNLFTRGKTKFGQVYTRRQKARLYWSAPRYKRFQNRKSPADRLRQGYGGPPKLHAKAEAGHHQRFKTTCNSLKKHPDLHRKRISPEQIFLEGPNRRKANINSS